MVCDCLGAGLDLLIKKRLDIRPSIILEVKEKTFNFLIGMIIVVVKHRDFGF